MRNLRKYLAVLAMVVLCAFTVGAQAATLDNAWYADHLTTVIPTVTGDEIVTLNTQTAEVAEVDGQTTVTANAFEGAVNNADTLVSIKLVKDANGAWTLDANPLSASFRASGVPQGEAAVPTAEELAALIEVSGLCGHDDVAVEIAECATVTAFDDYALVTVDPALVAAKLEQLYAEEIPHVPGQLAQAVATYTQDENLSLTHVKVALDIECGETIYEIVYKDGVNGEAFGSHVIHAKRSELTPAFPLGEPTREGWQFEGWDPELDTFVKRDMVYTATWRKIHTVVYTDGVEDEELFADEEYKVLDGDATPACTVDPTELRPGYTFMGWEPVVSETATADVTYVAQWEIIVYNITYVNVPDGVENPNPTTYTIEDEEIVFAELVTDGFLNWTPASIPAGSIGDVEVTANIVAKPTIPKPATVADGYGVIQCVTHGEHKCDDSAMLGSGNSKTVVWNAELKRWEAPCSVRVSLINNTTTRKNYFGNTTHYNPDGSTLKNQTFNFFWNTETGKWEAIDPIVIEVWCATEPTPFTADNLPSIGNALWARDCTNTKNYNRYNSVAGDVISITEMTKDEDGNYWMTVTVSGANAVKAFQDKYGAEYVACDGEGDDGHVSDAAGHGAYAGTYQFVFKYAAFSSTATIDYTKNNWKFDQPATTALGTGYMKLNGYYIWMSRDFTVTYTDGAEDEEVFADVVYTVRESGATPAFGEADPVREGYVFTGWTPEVAETVTESVTYTATWEKIWTITYVGVPEGVENPNPTTYLTSETPITLADIVTDGYLGWDIPVIEEGTEGDLTITANIVAKPTLPKRGTNVSDGLLLFQCTRCGEEHSWLDNTAFSANSGRTYWNYDLKRWETFVYAQASTINSTQVRKNYFGNYQHYYADDAQSVKYYLYYAPDVEGETSLGNPTTGFWFAMDGNPIKIDVWCYGEPTPFTADNIPKIGSSNYAFWLRDCTNTKNYVRHNTISDAIISIGEMTKDDAGNYWITVTVDGSKAVADFQAKYGAEYLPCDGEGDEGHASAAAGHGAYAGTYQFVFKYAAFSSSATIDYSKNNWKFDETSTVALGYKKLNGYEIWMSRDFVVTYTDGVEDEEVFADVVYTVRENGATPAFGEADPVREGYVFSGWTPEVAETVTESVTYTASWEEVKSWTVTYVDGVEDEEVFADVAFTVINGEATPAFGEADPVREGYVFSGWTPEVAETVTEDATYTATWTKTWTVTYFDWYD